MALLYHPGVYNTTSGIEHYQDLFTVPTVHSSLVFMQCSQSPQLQPGAFLITVSLWGNCILGRVGRESFYLQNTSLQNRNYNKCRRSKRRQSKSAIANKANKGYEEQCTSLVQHHHHSHEHFTTLYDPIIHVPYIKKWRLLLFRPIKGGVS